MSIPRALHVHSVYYVVCVHSVYCVLSIWHCIRQIYGDLGDTSSYAMFCFENALEINRTKRIWSNYAICCVQSLPRLVKRA